MKTLKQIREDYNGKILNQVEMPDEIMLDEAKQGASLQIIPSTKKMPVMLIFKRVSYRVFPKNQVVALYYSSLVDKYLSVPFGPDGNLNLSESTILEDIEEGVKWDTTKGVVKGALHGAVKGMAVGNAIAATPGAAIGGVVGAARGAIKGGRSAYNKAKDTSVDEHFRMNLENLRNEGVVGDTIEKGRKWVQNKVKDSPTFKAAQEIGHHLPGYEDAKTAKQHFAKGDYLNAAKSTIHSLGKAAATGLSAAGAVGAAALTGGAAGSKDGDRTTSSKGSGERIRDVAPAKSYSSWEKAPSTSDPITKKRQQIASLKENKMSDIRKMVNENVEIMDLSINGKEVTLNTSMAKRILEVYDSVNTKNKRIVEGMLNEDLESFKKLLNFSIRN